MHKIIVWVWRDTQCTFTFTSPKKTVSSRFLPLSVSSDDVQGPCGRSCRFCLLPCNLDACTQKPWKTKRIIYFSAFMFYFSSKTLKLVEALSGELKDSLFALRFVCSECLCFVHALIPRSRLKLLIFFNAFSLPVFVFYFINLCLKSQSIHLFFNNRHLQISMFRYGFNNAGTMQAIVANTALQWWLSTLWD